MAYYLALISPSDSPIYETYLSSSKPHNQIASSSTSTFPSWSSFPTFNQQQQQQQPGVSSSSNVNANPNAPALPPKDPFPPQFLGGPGTSSKPNPVGLERPPPQGVEKHVMQMIAFSSLDIVEDVMVGTGSMYLKMVDKFNEWNVSAFVAPSGESLDRGPGFAAFLIFLLGLTTLCSSLSTSPARNRCTRPTVH